MPAKSENAPLVIEDFPGLFNNVDGRDVPEGGAQVLVNMAARVTGQMQSRKGLKLIGFENIVTVGLGPV